MELRGPVFIEPSTEDFLLLLGGPLQGGSGQRVPVYVGSLRQRGFGFLSLLRSIGSSVLPYLGKTVLPAVTPALGEFATGMLSDITSGNISTREALKQRGQQALKQSWENFRSQHGRGSRRKAVRRLGVPKKLRNKKQVKGQRKRTSGRNSTTGKKHAVRRIARKSPKIRRKLSVPFAFSTRKDVFNRSAF
jgi:hypothetical protein